MNAQIESPLHVSTPEDEGVSSADILHFLDAVGKSKNELHSFIFLRHGKVISEGWWSPYKNDLKHSMYSASKSFTSTAIGFAISENKIKLSDKVVSFFPNDLPDSVSPFLKELTIQDLLTMSVGQDPEPTFDVTSKYKNWIKGFLAAPLINKPGTVFLYNTLGSFMLSAILQKVTGQKVIEYLRPRLFDPLGISGMDWEENLQSINTGGWGLRIKTEDMAKFGQLYLQKGYWQGTQVLPAEWVAEATSVKIIQHPLLSQSKRDSSDWEQGYGYQFWRSRHHSYRADGAYGQYILVLPEQDAVIAIQSETPDMQDELNLVWQYLLPSIHKEKLPSDSKNLNALHARLSSLILPTKPDNVFSSGINLTTDRNYIFEPNERNIESLTLQIKDGICYVMMQTKSDTYKLTFGSGVWRNGQTNKQMNSLFSNAKENYALLFPFKVAGSYYWKDDLALVLQLRYIESPHTEITTCYFDGKSISMDIQNSFQFNSKKITLTGVLK